MAAELDAAGLLATAKNPNPRRPTYGDLAALPYLDAVLRESLRIMPVSVFMYRQTVDPVTDLAGYAVPANTEVMVRAAALGTAVPWSGSPERRFGGLCLCSATRMHAPARAGAGSAVVRNFSGYALVQRSQSAAVCLRTW